MNGHLLLSTDDYEVWQALKSGNEAAFDHIYSAYFAKLYAYGSHLCPDRSLVKDCIQNLFVGLWNNRATLGDVHSIRHYLYQSLRRKVIYEINRARHWIHPEAVMEDGYFEVSFSHEYFLITGQLDEENRRKLLNAFQQLTKRQKEAVFLRFYDNLSYADIAAIMAMKDAKYARTLIYRALDVLKVSIRSLATV